MKHFNHEPWPSERNITAIYLIVAEIFQLWTDRQANVAIPHSHAASMCKTLVLNNCLLIGRPTLHSGSDSATHVKTWAWRVSAGNDLFAVVKQTVNGFWSTKRSEHLFDWVLEQVGRPKSKGLSVRKQFTEGNHCWVQVSENSILNKHNNWYESTLQLSRQLLRVIYTPLPLPESCGYGQDSVHTSSLCSEGRHVVTAVDRQSATVIHMIIWNLNYILSTLLLLI